MLRNKNENSLAIALERCARFGVKPGLDAIRAVCAAMGNPQDSCRTVHVAGTNGKGAVCALVDSALRAAGFRTGRYTSPHLVSLTERFFLDGAPVSASILDSAFRNLPSPLNPHPSTLNPQPLSSISYHPSSPPPPLTYFELLTATAFELYRQEKVDYLVLETGLGGRLDATNIVKRPDVCVITRIGLDHCDWLGHTLAEIAAEKGGIIKPEVPVVLGAMPDEAREVLERIAAERHAPCVYAPNPQPASAEGSDAASPQPLSSVSHHTSSDLTLNLRGKFNRENAVTALAALKVLGVDDDAIKRGFSTVVWPGRYQRIDWRGKRFLVDGAHNPPAMRALADSLKESAESETDAFSVRTVICGFCGDKDVAANLKILREVSEDVIAVPIRNPRSLPPERVAELMREAGFRTVRECPSLEAAIAAAPDGTVVCGSLFLVGEALEILGAMQGCSGLAVPNETFLPQH